MDLTVLKKQVFDPRPWRDHEWVRRLVLDLIFRCESAEAQRDGFEAEVKIYKRWYDTLLNRHF